MNLFTTALKTKMKYIIAYKSVDVVSALVFLSLSEMQCSHLAFINYVN